MMVSFWNDTAYHCCRQGFWLDGPRKVIFYSSRKLLMNSFLVGYILEGCISFHILTFSPCQMRGLIPNPDDKVGVFATFEV